MTLGDDWTKITNNDFNDFRMKGCYHLVRLREAGIVNPRPTLPTSYYKRHSTVNNIERPIKCNPNTTKYDMVTPLCNDTKFINSVNTENKFIIPDHVIIINKDQDRKEGIETSRVYPSDEPNPMGCHRNTLPFSDEGKSKASKLDQTKKISLVTLENTIFVTPEDKFICHAQVIMTTRDQGEKM